MTSWTWSHSRAQRLRDCPKAFEFGLESAPGSLRRDEYNLQTLAGVAAHAAIEAMIDDWRQAKEPTKEDLVVNSDAFIDDVLAAPDALTDRRNGAEFSSGEIARIRRRAAADVTTFIEKIWPRFNYHDYVGHEIEEEFSARGYPLKVRVDYVCRTTEGELHVVDWKAMRLPLVREGGHQLAVYGLWATIARGVESAKIQPFLANLRIGEVKPVHVTADDLDIVVAWIEEDRKLVEDYIKDHFPVIPTPQKCAGCRFAARCPEGLKAISEEWG